MTDQNTDEKTTTETKSYGNEPTRWTKRDSDLAQAHTHMQKPAKGEK